MLLRRQIEDLEKGLKTSMLSRLLTALSLISLILVVLYLQSESLFTILICFVCILALYEWIANNFKNKLFGFFLIFNFGFWSIFLILGWESYFDNDIGSPLIMSFFLYGIIILNTALFDTFAYIIGSNFGKTFLTKKISPNKTLEGLVGGLFSSIIFGSLIGLSLVPKNYWIIFIFILGGLFAFLGDLLISFFKRQAGVKDTGTILPGHGGILDRIDSHLLATPLLIIILFLSVSL